MKDFSMFFKDLYQYIIIKHCNLFDEGYYLLKYPDVRKSDMNPLWHFVKKGWKEGRNPSKNFNTKFYLEQNTDVLNEKINPLIHYINFGQKEGRETIPQINNNLHSNQNRIVKDISKINHFIPEITFSSIGERKKISVIVTTYNHEKYITQCLESILMQKGNFDLEIIIGDDNSTDKTREIIQDYKSNYPDLLFLFPKGENIGIQKNLKRCLNACGGEYIAICEGDDYWIDEYKLQKQMNFLYLNKNVSMVFSSIIIKFENNDEFIFFNQERPLFKNEISTVDLIEYNYIGNFSCCMYKKETIQNLSPDLFDLFVVDWMFNLACSESGNIGYIDEYMSIYRKHQKGVWSSKPMNDQNRELLSLIDEYNEYFNYRYNSEFQKLKQNIIRSKKNSKDLLILDTLFPHPLSSFRYQEFISLMKEFPNSYALTTGEHLPALRENRTIQEIINEFNIEFPELRDRTFIIDHNIEPYNARLAYVEFLNNMKVFLASIERLRIPFIFTLYPGGGFQINSPESDKLLSRICNSPQFRRIIVTQKITYDYLINNHFCEPEKIEFIFGVVSPLKILEQPITHKYYGYEKDTLDICFVAHKYMPKGVDKGYDIFIEAAKILVKSHNNINFHVVGSFNEDDIPIGELEGRIFFYGLRSQEWFDNFYIDKDIIISPNIPFILQKGGFDGFPTASCTEAGARGLAILCTDILDLNIKFKDWEDLIIIPHNIEKIVDIISHLYENPIKIKEIANSGAKKIRKIYNFKNQIKPRIDIINHELEIIRKSEN